MVVIPLVRKELLEKELSERARREGKRILDSSVHPDLPGRLNEYTLVPGKTEERKTGNMLVGTLHSIAPNFGGLKKARIATKIQESVQIPAEKVELNGDELESLREHLLDVRRSSGVFAQDMPELDEKHAREVKYLEEKIKLLYPFLFPSQKTR